jgi:SAM-dependent methyltransferase
VSATEVGAARAGAAEARRFREAYAVHRAREGRGPLDEAALLALPYLRQGPFAREWGVRARSFEALLRGVVEPLARRSRRPLEILDLGAGNGWLCHRLLRAGHHALALDLRIDRVDGLGAAAGFGRHLPSMFPRVSASFERLPLARAIFDLAVFNASLHYTVDLERALSEAAGVVVPGGSVAIMDTPFYRTDEAGAAMVSEKRKHACRVFGDLEEALVTPSFVEYLTARRLQAASRNAGLRWRRVRVIYPAWYELRGVVAHLRGRRQPSRFDVWSADVP